MKQRGGPRGPDVITNDFALQPTVVGRAKDRPRGANRPDVAPVTGALLIEPPGCVKYHASAPDPAHARRGTPWIPESFMPSPSSNRSPTTRTRWPSSPPWPKGAETAMDGAGR